jgi:polyisoprenoid-binding protein YceI
MQRSVKVALVAVIAVIVLGGAGFYFFVLRDNAPPPVTLANCADTTTSAGGATRATPEGAWKVAGGPNVFVGYRMMELFGGDTIKKEAVGRTDGVTGTMTVSGGQVTAVDVTADVTRLTSDKASRDNFIKTSALETEKIPEVTFVLTRPVALPAGLAVGTAVDATATGDLTLHGQTRSVTVPVQGCFSGATINVSGRADVQLADYQIDKPQVPGITVDEAGQLELSLIFVPA